MLLLYILGTQAKVLYKDLPLCWIMKFITGNTQVNKIMKKMRILRNMQKKKIRNDGYK